MEHGSEGTETSSTGTLWSFSYLEVSVACCNNPRFLLACAQRPTSKLQNCASACSQGFLFPGWWQQPKCLSSCLPGRPQRVKLKTLFKVLCFFLKQTFFFKVVHFTRTSAIWAVMQSVLKSCILTTWARPCRSGDSESYFFCGLSTDNNTQAKRICRQ